MGTTSEKILSLFKEGYEFHMGGGDTAHGITFGFHISVKRCSDTEYAYHFYEEINYERKTEEHKTLQEADLLNYICQRNSINEEDILLRMIKY